MFSDEVGNTGVSLMAKVLQAILDIFKKVYETAAHRMSAEYKIEKLKLENELHKAEELNFADKIDGKVGFVKYKDLERAGVPLTATEIRMTNDELKEFAGRCKREGITITALDDIRERELNGKKVFIVQCKTSDLEKLSQLADLMNDEKRIAVLEGSKREILAKGELSASDKLNAAALDREIQSIRDGYTYGMNDKQALGVVEKAVIGETQNGVSFDEAIDRYTGGKLYENTTSYIADAKNPDRYIECKSCNDTFRGKDYTKTDYTVYNGGDQILSAHDGRFEGREKNYWGKQKAVMREEGGIGNLVLRFPTLAALEAYRQAYRMQNAAELAGLNVGGEGRDYAGIVKGLEDKLNDLGAIYKDGIVSDKTTGAELTLAAGMDDTERSRVAEAVVIGKQIDNYTDFASLEPDMMIAWSNALTAEGTDGHAAALDAFNEVKGNYDMARDMEAYLYDQRMSINAIQAEHDVRQQSLDRGGQDRDEVKRDERVSDRDDRVHTLDEYKGMIEDRRKNEGAKGNDMKDRAVAGSNKAKPAKAER